MGGLAAKNLNRSCHEVTTFQRSVQQLLALMLGWVPHELGSQE